MSDDDALQLDDWAIWGEAPPVDEAKQSRARKRRLKAEITKWRDHYRRHGQLDWVAECDANLKRLDDGWVGEA
jgi:hypothetical protein